MKISFPYKKQIASLAILIVIMQSAFAQDLHFSQFFEAPLLRNPSLAGIFTGDYRIQGVYRDQWNSFTNAYRTGSFNGEYKMPVGQSNDFLTVGMQILYDKAGTAGLTTSEIFPALNYHKSLSSEKTMYLSLGFMGGYAEKRIDRSKITTNNQFDGAAYNPSLADGETFPTPDVHYWDGSVGMSFNMTFGTDQQNSMFLGAAYHHLNRPRNSFYQNAQTELDPKYVFSAGVKINVSELSYLTLQADHSMQGDARETIGGAMYSYKLGEFTDDPKYILNVGAFLRWKDAFIPVIKLDMLPLSLALSYDVNISPLETVSQGRGGIEISIAYIGFLNRDNSAKYKVLCPRF
ncbi:MAG: PorP/SprF family type IX secretion system membrane protein [Bacteroidetes bacterium]|nr:PorP/SprF family type IX secretion system membrane protein [Bacteroidota bacterium]